MVLKNSGTNYVRNVFLYIEDASLFDEVIHNFFGLFEVAVRGKENAKGSAINIMAVSREIFLPV